MESIEFVQYVRRMPGTTQSHLLRCSDGHLYVVKFRNNPEGTRVLVNEMLASRMAERLGLPVPPVAVVRVSPEQIASRPQLSITISDTRLPCPPWEHFGSRYVAAEDCTFEWLPQFGQLRLEAARAFCGMLVFDKWTCNVDTRQALFFRDCPDSLYNVTFIDHGSCFGGTAWRFRDAPLHGVPHEQRFLLAAQSDDFEAWLNAIAGLSLADLFTAAADVPPSWYERDGAALAAMLQLLWLRRLRLRELVAHCRHALTEANAAHRTGARWPVAPWPAAHSQVPPAATGASE